MNERGGAKMDELQLELINDLPKQRHSLYQNMTFDGQSFYLTNPKENAIVMLDEQFQFVKEYHMNRPYQLICYNKKKDCFYAVDMNQSEYIYQLNHQLEEMNYFCISEYKEPYSKIMNITYSENHDALIIVFDNQMIEMNDNGEVFLLSQNLNQESYHCFLDFGLYYIVIVWHKDQQCLYLFHQDGCLIKQFCIPCDYKIIDIVLTSHCDQQTLEFLILAIKNCRLCLLRCVICIEPCSCCKENCCMIPCVEKRVCDILESIALQETALSHIINAEGEKIQKAIDIATDVCDLLKIDQSVNQTITQVMLLENVLYSKLQAILQEKECR